LPNETCTHQRGPPSREEPQHVTPPHREIQDAAWAAYPHPPITSRSGAGYQEGSTLLYDLSVGAPVSNAIANALPLIGWHHAGVRERYPLKRKQYMSEKVPGCLRIEGTTYPR